MADWSVPTTTTNYLSVLSALSGRDTDAYTMAESPTNQPTGAIRYNRANNLFQEWSGAAWVDKVLAIVGGGTGSTTASGARTNLGLGTMATQNANGIAVTGGTLSGITAFTLNANLAFDADGTRNLGSNAAKVGTTYIKNGLVIPVGLNKYVTS